MSDPQKKLYLQFNEAQKKAIDYQGKRLLVVAGPGTGKTHTLVNRIVTCSDKLQENENILAITFSNKAACEMQERLGKSWEGYAESSFVGTFHSFALNLLRQFIEKTDLPENFEVKTPKEIDESLKILWQDYTDAQRKKMREKISLWKAHHFQDVEPDDVHAYNEFLRELGILDFDDLLVEVVRLLRCNETILNYVRKAYPYIFVDEYQDINAIQRFFLSLLVTEGSHITAIGDPNQAIYGFRGSDVKFFDRFVEDFLGAQVIHLCQNYRSTDKIVNASAQLMRESEFEVPEITANIYSQERLTIYQAVSEKAEAEYVVHEIEKLIGGSSMFSWDSKRVSHHESLNVSFSDIAIIYRLNAQRKAFEEALNRSGMPYQVSGNSSHHTLDEMEYHVEKINLLTMHASKGLEFKVVFVVGCEEGLVPLDIKGFDCHSEEERRLFYVAMTRAKERLYFTSSQRRLLYGNFLSGQTSPFVQSIDEVLKKNDVQEKSLKKKEKAKQIDLFE